MPTHDVVIVGAAPAGSTAALVLARAGHRVALLDRAAFPRTKVCGNCVNPLAWEIWDQLGLTDAFRALPHQPITGFDIHSEGRHLYRHDFPSSQLAPRGVARDVLDDWLRREAETAGAEFFPETTVTGIDAKSGIVQTTRGEFSGQLVIGADGRNSIVARLSGLMPKPRRCHRVAWQCAVPAPASLDDRIHMHVFEEGYFGYTRYNPTHAVISLVLDSRRLQDPQKLVRRVLPHLDEQAWLRMNPITRAPARTGTGRVWLAGDAARVVEPFTGQGITFALDTGRLAGMSASRGLESGDLAPAFQAYKRAHRRLYRRKVWVNTLLRWTLTTPSHIVRLVRNVDRLPRVVSFLSSRVHATS